jgi:hypothetical protein
MTNAIEPIGTLEDKDVKIQGQEEERKRLTLEVYELQLTIRTMMKVSR